MLVVTVLLKKVQTEFTVVLKAGASRISCCEMVKELTSLGLKEAKDVVDECSIKTL
jgi:ribosomal protein L7/L12